MGTENPYQQHPLEELMRNELSRTSAICALLVAGLAATATAQQPPAPPANPNANIVVEKPTYVTVPLEITVNKPVAEVWKLVCDQPSNCQQPIYLGGPVQGPLVNK